MTVHLFVPYTIILRFQFRVFDQYYYGNFLISKDITLFLVTVTILVYLQILSVCDSKNRQVAQDIIPCIIHSDSNATIYYRLRTLRIRSSRMQYKYP